MNTGCGMMRLAGRHILVIAVLLAVSRLASTAATTLPGEAGLEDLQRFAVDNNPEIEAAFHRWQASLERIPQERALPDPKIAYGYFIEQMEARQVFRFEQMVPGFGKRGLREDVASEEAGAEARALEDAILRVRATVQTAYADALYVQDATALMEENLKLLRQLQDLARREYQSAQVTQADVLRLEMEADTAQAELDSLHDRRRPVAAQLNATLGREPGAALPRLRRAEAPAPPAGDTVSVVSAVEDHPRLMSGAHAIARAGKARDLARRESRPDFTLGIEYMDNRGNLPNELLGMVAVNLPVWRDRYRAAERGAASEMRRAEREYAAVRNELQTEAEMALFEMREAGRTLRLLETQLLPKAQQRLRLIEAGYRTGEVGFPELVEARRALLETELGHARARSEHLRRHAGWERLTGRANAGALAASQGTSPASQP